MTDGDLTENLRAIRAALGRIDQSVAGGTYGRSEPWGGAGVIISDRDVDQGPPGFYPDKRTVVTPHAGELSWLFEQLWRQNFSTVIIGPGEKEEFFGRIANAANRQLRRTGPGTTARDLLGSVVHEAYSIVEDIEDGVFEGLLVAPGGMVYDDLIADADRQGYMSVEETRQWFAERGLE